MSFHQKGAFLLRLYRLTLIIAFASLMGCVKTEHPLSEIGKIVVDPALVGVWVESDPVFGENATYTVRINMVGEERYRFEFMGDAHKLTCVGKVIEAERESYFEIETFDYDGPTKDAERCIPSFVQVERKENWIALRAPEAMAFRNHVLADTEISGKVVGNYPFCFVTINSKADVLAKFLVKYNDVVFGRRAVYRRIE